MNILLTGGAGFIGSNLLDALLVEGHTVTVVDNFDPFYPRRLKEENLAGARGHPCVRIVDADICNMDSLNQLAGPYDAVVHLAAKAGVQPSIADPSAYQETNIRGTQNLLELARTWRIKQFVFASSSSVYGTNPHTPWSEDDHVLLPISPYASTKVSGELMGHVYSHLYDIRFIALRFFTVYGPRQRPDLAIRRFSEAIINRQPIRVFGDGSTSRDYTHINDIVAGIQSAIRYERSQYEVMNLGNGLPISLSELVRVVEVAVGETAVLTYEPEQPGDVRVTFADISKARTLLEWQPRVSLQDGMSGFVEWLTTTTENFAYFRV